MKRLAYPALLLAICIAASAVRTQSASSSLVIPDREDSDVSSLREDIGDGLVTPDELIADRLLRWGISNPDPAPKKPRDRADSLAWDYHHREASRIPGRKIVVSIYDRRLWLLDGQDTLLSAPAGVGMGLATRAERTFDFSTPRGPRRVIGKEADPVWVPPDWHYLETFSRVEPFPNRGVPLEGGAQVIRRGNRIGILRGDDFEPLPPADPITFAGVTYIPPLGTVHRQIPGILGKFKLDTGAGILIHGTDDPLSVGFPSTHGCIRLADDDLEYLYQRVSLNTPVYIY